MSNFDRHKQFRPTVMALALAAALGTLSTGSARAADDESAPPSPVSGSISVGAGAVSGDAASRALFGQYNGLRSRSNVGLFNFDYSRRDDQTGRSVVFTGTNMLSETRELNFVWKKQGDWRFAAQYGELVHYDPRTANTGLTGAGTTAPQVNLLPGGTGTGTDMLFKTKRAGLGLSFSKWLSPVWAVEASVKSENKNGTRLSGIGFNCPSAVAPGCAGTTGANTGSALLMLPEPVNSNHTQIEGRLNYAGEKLRISGGYYGSIFSNNVGSMTPGIPGSLNNPLGMPLPLNTGLQSILSQAIALAPDNQAHNFDFAGSYLFTPTTRANFKLGYGEASQLQNFAGAGLTGAPNGITNLGAKVASSVVQAGFSSRPTPRLSLTGDFRYLDRNDRTPIAAYNLEGTTTYTNMRLPNTRLSSKLQASYRLTNEVTGTLGANYESIDRGTLTPTSGIRGVSALRQKTDELGWRAELRRRMTETFSGSVSYITSNRTGSSWLGTNSGTGVTPVNNFSSGAWSSAIFMPTLANRQRDKVRLFGNWQPMDELTLQFSVETGQDHYYMPSQYGLQASRMALYNVDFNYALSDDWSVNGYLSTGNQTLNQARPAGYLMSFENQNTTFGVGVTGKPTDKLDIGGGVSFISDRSIYSQGLDAGGNASNAALLSASGGLPDIVFRRAELRGFGRYAFNKSDAVRVDLIHQRAKFNDWAWGYGGTAFAYSDSTTIYQPQQANVTYLGVMYIHSWQ